MLTNRPAPTFVLLAVLFLNGCRIGETETGSKTPSRGEMMRRFRESRRVLVVYGSSDRAAAARYEELGSRLLPRRSSWTVIVQSDRQTSYEDLTRSAVYLIGTAESNRWVRELSRDLPVEFTSKGFRFLDVTYGEPTDVLRLVHPNPANVELPLFLTTGNREESLPAYFDLPRRGDYQVLRNGMTLVMGTFVPSSNGIWVADPSNHRTFKPEGATILTSEHYDYCAHFESPDANELDALARRNEALYRAVESLLGKTSTEKTRYHVYADGEEKGLVTHNTKPAHIDPASLDIHAVLEEDRWGLAAKATVDQLLERNLGKPSRRALERGLATYLSRDEQGDRDYEYWAARLILAGQELPLDALLDDDRIARESSFIVDPLAGAFVAFLLDTDRDVPALYTTWSPSSSEVAQLESEWLRYSRRRAESYRSRIATDRAGFARPSGSFQKGFTHAHEGYEIYNGYLSQRSDQALRELKSLGVDSVAIVPYTFMRDPRVSTPLPIPESSGSENDEGVIHAISTAKALGMAVMLKPQIWTRGGWPGDIEMTTEGSRRDFFAYYFRWIRHYALMAELYDVETLCIGTELVKMTVGYEPEWAAIIRRLRELYSGELVYAANWDRELEGIRFWNLLDSIGVDAYYPLSGRDDPSDKELAAGMRRALARIRAVHDRYGKPVLVTEMGFASSPAPWKKPHEDPRGAPVRLEDQARCYRVALAGLRESESWIRGVFWWKWPSDLERGGVANNGFTPNGKPAEEVVRRWYGLDW